MQAAASVNNTVAELPARQLHRGELVTVQVIGCRQLGCRRMRLDDDGASCTIGVAMAVGAFPRPTLTTRAAATISAAPAALRAPLTRA